MKNWPYPRVAAHRGGGTLAPENTLAGLRAAAQYGHTMVEFDTKLSADRVAFLLHDDTLERTSSGCGAAAQQHYAALATLDAGRWHSARFAGERIPTLAQAAACCQALALAANVEIKPCPGRDEETGRLVAQEAARSWAQAGTLSLPLSPSDETGCLAAREAARLRAQRVQAGTSQSSPSSPPSSPSPPSLSPSPSQSPLPPQSPSLPPPPLLSSFSFTALTAARDAASALPRALLFGRVPDDWRAQTAALGCVSLHADHRFLSEPLVARIRAAGLFVLAYTVDDLARARELVQWGVNTVCTDRPDLIGPHALDARIRPA